MKKKLLFVIDSLDCAGAEKSLVTLLGLLDYRRYSVDLLLFGYGGMLESLIPNQVTLLSPLKYTTFTNLNVINALLYSVRQRDFKMLKSRVKYSTKIRRKTYSNPQKARIFWENISQVIESNPKTYDAAISYAQGIPTFYVAEKVKAKKKYAWVNVSYRLNEDDQKFQMAYYNQYDRIVAVSHSTKEIFIETFPAYSDKVDVIYDINNPFFISKMSNVAEGFDDDFNGIRLLTIGRLAKQKGYDMALTACHYLKEKGINFRWYALGKGPLKKEIEAYIKDNDLSDHFKLLGVKSNPYPYLKQADIYVQTSRYEGFGLAIAEARMLNKPIVTTRFDAVFNQMVDNENGLVVDMTGEAVYKGILKFINDNDLRRRIINNLQSEKKGNVEEIEKFIKLIS